MIRKQSEDYQKIRLPSVLVRLQEIFDHRQPQLTKSDGLTPNQPVVIMIFYHHHQIFYNHTEELIQSGEPFLPTDANPKPACLQKSTTTVVTGQEKIKDLKWIIMLFLVSLLSFFSLMTMEVIKLDGENYL